jgi:transposase InsO family protein
MRYSKSEKMEIIRLVENSDLSARQTLEELEVPRSSFYRWYDKYLSRGYDGLANSSRGPRQFWNKVPESERKRIVQIALEYPDKSPRELAWHITDTQEYYISESTVYRILREYDLITSPAFIVMKASDSFKDKTTFTNEMWQTDFTYLKIINWGWYYLATVIDDYSRYVISWKLFTTMKADDVKQVLDLALERTGLNQIKVKHKPRLLSDNGPCYLSGELKDYLQANKMEHRRGAPYHPQTQGKIERYHRTMKNIVKLDNYYYPSELESKVEEFVNYYNKKRYHESIDNITPEQMFNGERRNILTKRDKTKRKTLKLRKQINLSKSINYNFINLKSKETLS